MMNKRMRIILAVLMMTGALNLAGCGAASSTKTSGTDSKTENNASLTAETANASSGQNEVSADGDYFSDRDMEQTPDLTDAEKITVSDGETIDITKEGVYLVSGTAKNCTIRVDADQAKVQLVLDGVEVENEDFPCIYVVQADKVFVTTTDSNNSLKVSGAFKADGETNTDAVIFAKDDLTLNGTGVLNVESPKGNGISGKDEVTITGGTYNITAYKDAIEANDSVAINGGTFDLNAGEAIEGTVVLINDGNIAINANDDGINASAKSESLTPSITINGGTININMAAGDTDALDSNGDLYINGGTVTITGQFAFDFDGTGKMTGGTVTVNGQEVTEIENSMQMGGGKMQMEGGNMNGGENPMNGNGNFMGNGRKRPGD